MRGHLHGMEGQCKECVEVIQANQGPSVRLVGEEVAENVRFNGIEVRILS